MHRQQRQVMVERWVQANFGLEAMDPAERGLRLVEEAMELAQALGTPRSKMANVFAAIYSKEPGDPFQEAGGVGMCLLACCESIMISADDAELEEIARVHRPEVMEKCRKRNELNKRDGTSTLKP